MQAYCPCWRSWSSRTSRWCASSIMVEIDETEDENDGWWSPKTSTNHVVATGINHPVTVTQYHLLRNKGCRKSQRHNENHGSRRIKHLFLVSQIIIFSKSRFTATMEITIHKEKISHLTFHRKKKGPITSHENTLYHPQWMYGTVPKSLPCGYADCPWMLSNSWHVVVYRKADRLLSVLMDEFQK